MEKKNENVTTRTEPYFDTDQSIMTLLPAQFYKCTCCHRENLLQYQDALVITYEPSVRKLGWECQVCLKINVFLPQELDQLDQGMVGRIWKRFYNFIQRPTVHRIKHIGV